MSGRASWRALGGLALDGLRRKWGRNLLTMSGVFLGVLALTLIVSLGEGITRLITTTVSNGDNMRQIGLSGGLGNRIDFDAEVTIVGVESDARRARLRRAALARRRPGTFIGRRAQTLDAATMETIGAMEHVESVKPIVIERYTLELGKHERGATATLGIDDAGRRYADRIICGRYFSGSDAGEVLLHEYLGYQWGYRTVAELQTLVGKTIDLTRLGSDGGGNSMPARILQQVTGSGLLESLDEAERAALPGIMQKLREAFTGDRPEVTAASKAPIPMKVVGIVRELEAGDPFDVVQDGNAFQVDLFLPSATAKRLYLDSQVNEALGYQRVVVIVDEAANAREVEENLREKGFTAFSVASVVERLEGAVTAVTVIIAFLTGIALLVAALGIVNTMITSVLERRREIGLWKAVGATNGQIRSVFLLEAGLIGLVGGLAGLLAARLLMIPGESIAAGMIEERAVFPLSTGIFHMPTWLPIAGPVLATTVAMLASLYPSARAARIDPVRALRHD